MKIAVIGAGIMGMSSAYLIKETYPKSEVTVFAENFSPDTTSDCAAGVWYPGPGEDNLKENIKRWSKASLDYGMDIIKNDPAAHLKGFSMCHNSCITRKGYIEEPFWKDIALNFKMLNERDLQMFPRFIKSGYSYTMLVVNTTKRLHHLKYEFQKQGGEIIRQKINSLDSLFNFDVIINCSGFGARDLFGDKNVYPIRGQTIAVKAPWIKESMEVLDVDEHGRTTYIFVKQDIVLLGGTRQINNDKLTTNEEDRKCILQSASKMIPSLRHATILKHGVGLRPGRNSVRLEREEIRICHPVNGQEKDMAVIHNYGHSGHGITLSWGCTKDVLGLLNDIMLEFRKQTAKL